MVKNNIKTFLVVDMESEFILRKFRSVLQLLSSRVVESDSIIEAFVPNNCITGL